VSRVADSSGVIGSDRAQQPPERRLLGRMYLVRSGLQAVGGSGQHLPHQLHGALARRVHARHSGLRRLAHRAELCAPHHRKEPDVPCRGYTAI
jgi:hypothetical protein